MFITTTIIALVTTIIAATYATLFASKLLTLRKQHTDLVNAHYEERDELEATIEMLKRALDKKQQELEGASWAIKDLEGQMRHMLLTARTNKSMHEHFGAPVANTEEKRNTVSFAEVADDDLPF